MDACGDCLKHSALRAEALSLYEQASFARAEAAEVLRLPPHRMLEALGSRYTDLDIALRQRIDVDLEDARRTFGLWAMCLHDPAYPSRLLMLPDPPPVLYGIGERDRFAELGVEGIAIVGSRRASAYGREVAYSLGNAASSVGLTVVSGMALGIDGAAHRGALQGGGRTIAVMAGSPERPYPRSHRLLHEQIAATGAIVSESPPGSEARRWAFVARNRIIAGLARMTVLAEAAEGSGALHTVRFAEQMDCAIGAVPGPVTAPGSAGPNELLRSDGAVLVRGIDDIVTELKLDRLGPPRPSVSDLSQLEERVVDCVAAGQRTPRAIASELQPVGQRELARALGRLELIGLLERLPSGEYARTG